MLLSPLLLWKISNVARNQVIGGVRPARSGVSAGEKIKEANGE
jgi:hypothetical protein